jgi:hypothetical protein
MRTPIYHEIFSVSDTNHTVQQVNYTFEEAARDAFAAFFSDARVKSIDADELGGGTFTFRMYGRVPILAFTEDDDETVYFSGDERTLNILARAGVEKIDDLLEKPRDPVGGWRRTRMLHKHTPLSWRRKRTNRTRRTRRKQRKTLRKK